ncbi:sensor histidine kinase [Inhella proteolytica]|uniref:Histidine kinase n=1 Tax=Inhella proteolytica TaxID=2795029 RepID=A0A931NC84_9BURK|nr:histidine kinase [Inhella proteolytica]MBH9575297.1 histidine kinase [Inhella proteolytica]
MPTPATSLPRGSVPPAPGPWIALGQRVPAGLRPALAAVAIWTLILTAMCVAIYSDVQRQGQTVDFTRLWLRNLPIYLPLMALSLFLHWLFARHGPALAHPPRALGVFLLLALLFMPPYMVYQELAEAWWHGKPPGPLWELLTRQPAYSWWMDTVLLGGAYTVQMALSGWQRSRQREQQLQQTEHELLGLRLSLLQGQLEPHFLFNCLNSVSALVRGQQPEAALSALARLADLLRYALRASRSDWVSVADELDFVRDYLELQRLRFGAALQLSWEIEEHDWSSLALPPLLLQPLVENAIHHGLEAQGGSGQLHIALRLLPQERLQLQLRNSLPAQGSDRSGHGLGLASTRERLTLLYGAQAGLQTERSADEFRLTLSVPPHTL